MALRTRSSSTYCGWPSDPLFLEDPERADNGGTRVEEDADAATAAAATGVEESQEGSGGTGLDSGTESLFLASLWDESAEGTVVEADEESSSLASIFLSFVFSLRAFLVFTELVLAETALIAKLPLASRIEPTAGTSPDSGEGDAGVLASAEVAACSASMVLHTAEVVRTSCRTGEVVLVEAPSEPVTEDEVRMNWRGGCVLPSVPRPCPMVLSPRRIITCMGSCR